ncbi:MAG TPA: dienelactone hydrolase [Cytophagales bacterium]|jgi:pimeloyl-ACP methyl ester carboxylesterase|nr:dienelactone hydrolase [Cytophagales bacterium]
MQKEDFTILSSHADRPFSFDITYVKDGNKKPVILFMHGFKGFKDWGHFPMMAEYFARSGVFFIKMNFSHNGTTPGSGDEFSDLFAFGENNFSIEMDDVGDVIDFIYGDSFRHLNEEMDFENVFLMGHSRGGSIALLATAEREMVKGAISMAAVSDLEKWLMKNDKENWMTNGVIHVKNGRTGQNMPLHFQIVEDFYNHQSRLDLKQVLKKNNKPIIAFHGSNDEALSPSMLDDLKSYNPEIQDHVIDGAGHTFGGTHPYHSCELPEHTQQLAQRTIDFIGNC